MVSDPEFIAKTCAKRNEGMHHERVTNGPWGEDDQKCSDAQPGEEFCSPRRPEKDCEKYEGKSRVNENCDGAPDTHQDKALVAPIERRSYSNCSGQNQCGKAGIPDVKRSKEHWLANGKQKACKI